MDKQHAVINYEAGTDEHKVKDLGSLNGVSGQQAWGAAGTDRREGDCEWDTTKEPGSEEVERQDGSAERERESVFYLN